MNEQLNLFEVVQTVEQEGFDYCFRCYSTWEEVKDTKFQLLLTKYLESAEALENYINNNSQDPLEDWLEE